MAEYSEGFGRGMAYAEQYETVREGAANNRVSFGVPAEKKGLYFRADEAARNHCDPGGLTANYAAGFFRRLIGFPDFNFVCFPLPFHKLTTLSNLRVNRRRLKKACSFRTVTLIIA
jgi:hypothetical protein